VNAAPLTLSLNGKPRDLPAGSTIASMLSEIGVDARVVAVARNGDVVRRDDYAATRLAPGDRIEIVRMVGGG
jgi:thiamine biosynthesis protein ThiS